MRLRHWLPVLLALAVVAASCGGDSGVFDTGTTAAAPEAESLVGPGALAVGEAIVAHLGPEPGMLAVGYALDRGHTAGQIAVAGLTRELQADGTITGIDPGLPVWGIFADLPEVGGSGGGGARVAVPILGYADEPNPYEVPIRADQYLEALGVEFEAVMSGRPTPSAPSAGGSSTTTTEPPAADDRARATIMIGLIVRLSDLGYSAEQIIIGIVLGEVGMRVLPTEFGLDGCWLLEDASDGSLVRPALPVLADPSFIDTHECREAIDRLAPPDANGSTTTTSTTTTSAAVDADGIQDGVYIGEVRVAGSVAAPVYEILDSEVQLDVTDQGVQAEVGYTLRVSVRSRLEDDPPVCVATIGYRYVGQQPALETLGFPLQPVSQEIRLLEGPECGIVDPWETTAEDYLLASFAEERTITLAGSFGEGRFEGYVSGTPLAVTAAIGG